MNRKRFIFLFSNVILRPYVDPLYLRLHPPRLLRLRRKRGRVCRAVLKTFADPLSLRGGGLGRGVVHVIGVELSIAQVAIAWLQSRISGLSNIQIKLGNAFHTDLSSVDVVYMFLMPETYEKIRPKLEKELKPGARVITYVWPIPGWTPDVVDEAEGSQKIYLFIKKPNG